MEVAEDLNVAVSVQVAVMLWVEVAVAEPVDMRAAEVQTTAVVEEVTVIITEHLHPEQTDTLQLAVAVVVALVRLMVPISPVAQVPLEVVAEALDFTVKGVLVVAAALAAWAVRSSSWTASCRSRP